MAFFGQNQPPSKFGRAGQPFDRIKKALSLQKSSAKPEPPKSKAIPSKPETFFGEKKDWTRQDFISKVAKNPLSIKGKGYSFYERKKMLEKTFSPGRFSTYISEKEAKTRLRELRKEEYQAKTGEEKSQISQMRKYIEKQTGLQGKY